MKANPLAWWEFKDCMDYLERSGLERHPLHDQVPRWTPSLLCSLFWCSSQCHTIML